MARLTGKVAVITGGAGGIGRAATKLFAEEGAKVLLVDLDEAALRDATEATGREAADYVVADTTQPDEVQRFVDTAVERFGASTPSSPTPGSKAESSPSRTIPSTSSTKLWRSTCAASGWASSTLSR